MEDVRKCSFRGCGEIGTKKWTKTTYYCGLHAAARAMRNNARNSSKYVPEIEDILKVWPKDDICPRCKRTFIYGQKVQNNASPSLQHFNPLPENENPIGVVCHRCNNNLRNLGDDIQAMDIPLNLRRCTFCDTLKPLEEFGSHSHRTKKVTYIRSHCLVCARKVTAINTAKRKQR